MPVRLTTHGAFLEHADDTTNHRYMERAVVDSSPANDIATYFFDQPIENPVVTVAVEPRGGEPGPTVAEIVELTTTYVRVRIRTAQDYLLPVTLPEL